MTFSILNSAHAWTSVILAGKCDSRRHTSSSQPHSQDSLSCFEKELWYQIKYFWVCPLSSSISISLRGPCTATEMIPTYKLVSMVFSIAYVWCIKILTWLRGCRVKIAKFPRLHCFAIIYQKRLEHKENQTKYRKMTWKPRSHRILIYWIWAIVVNIEQTEFESVCLLLVYLPLRESF